MTGPLCLVLAALSAALALGPPRPRALGRSRPTAGRRRRTASLPALAGVSAAVVVVAVVPGVPGTLGAPLAGLLAARAVSKMEPSGARRHRRQLESALPHVVDLMAASMAVGASPSAALERITGLVRGPMGDELAPWCLRIRLGSDPVSVWAEMVTHPVLGPLGRCLLRSAQSGAPVTQALNRLSDDLRDKQRTEVEGLARTVQVRAAVPLGVCFLPAFVLVGVVPLIAGSVMGFVHF